jgi:hypothetical protein
LKASKTADRASKIHVKRLVLVAAILSAWSALATAQSTDPASPSSVERVRAALLSTPPIVIPSEPEERHLGVLTFVPPDTPGEIVRVRVPIGALAANAAHSIAAANHRREERAAKEDVARALAAFLARKP